MHFRLRNVLAMVRKEGRTMMHDHALLAVILVQPVLYLVLFGLAITNDVNDAPWMVYDQSQTTLSRRLITDLSSMTALRPPEIAHSEDQLVDFLRRQDGMVGVVVPWNFDDKLERGQEAPIQVLINGAKPTSALRLTSYIAQAASQFSLSQLPTRDRAEQRVTQAAVSLEKRYWYNPGIKDRFGFLSAMPANMLTQILFMIAAVSLVRERERGTFEQLLSTPLSLAEIMVGKMIPYIGVGYIGLGIMLVGSFLCFGIAVQGSLVLLFFVALVFMLATMAFGIFCSAWAHNQQQAIFLSFFFMFPSVLISGILVPADNYPPLVSFLSHCLPARYVAHALRAIILKGAELSAVAQDLAFLTVFFLVFLWAAVRVTKPKLG
jgi:ABC-2 type transport system permease protein